MERAYSVLKIKSVADDADAVTIEGIASTPRADKMGDIVEPLGAQFKTPMPLLWQHRHDSPVGQVIFAKPQKDGIPFTAKLPIVREAGRLKERVDEAIQSLKYGLVAAVSIGFRPVEGAVEAIKTGYRFLKWDWHELSLVTIPANSDAVVNVIRSLDAPAIERKQGPGDSGKSVVKIIPKPRTTK